MFGRDIARYRRIMAVLLCAVIMLTLVVSSACIVCRAHHDCCGEGCAVCSFIQRCEEILRPLATASLSYAVIPPVMLLLLVITGAAVLALSSATLIGQNIRLND